jgi:hypothetical protein
MNPFDVEFAEITITPEQIARLRANTVPASYFVNMNVAGYLPDYDPNECETLAEAAGLLLDMAEQFCPARDVQARMSDTAWNNLVDMENGTFIPVLPFEVSLTDDDGTSYEFFITA